MNTANNERTVDVLDIEACPRASITNLNLTLVHDALGRPINIPVIVARGARNGPTFGLTAALHGNELNGIPVIHRLLSKTDLVKLKGCIVAVPVVNIPGLIHGKRVFSDGVDLNTILPGKSNGKDSEVYAHRFCQKVIEHFDYLIDLHTASFGRINSLYVRADMSHEKTAKMAHLQRPEIILHNQASDGTLRGHAMSLGIPSITVEVGNPHRYHPEYIKRTLAGIRAVLGEVGMTPKRKRKPVPPPILCSGSYWIYADHGGLLEVAPHVTDTVKKGDRIATLTDIFGRHLRDYLAPEDGIVIGKSVHPVGQTGARILHLGIITPDSPYPSAED